MSSSGHSLMKTLRTGCLIFQPHVVKFRSTHYAQDLDGRAFLTRCPTREGGRKHAERLAHMSITVCLSNGTVCSWGRLPADWWEFMKKKRRRRRRCDCWVILWQLRLLSGYHFSTQEWTRMVRSQRLMCLLSGWPSNLKPDLSVWTRRKTITGHLWGTTNWEFRLQQVKTNVNDVFEIVA